MLPPMRPAPAPAAAPLLPPMAPPATAPITVPMAALEMPLFAAALLGEMPVWLLAYARQSRSSARNWSKLMPVPGSTITVGPLGMVMQPARSSAAPIAATFTEVFMGSVGRLRGNALPACRAFLHIGVVGAFVV